MAQVTGIGTNWNLPNYAGELFSADGAQTPLLSMIGGLTGGMQSEHFEFPTAVLYDYPAAAQPDISENEAAAAPAAVHAAKNQKTNVTQIFQETVDLSYARLSSSGRVSTLGSVGGGNLEDERAFQIKHKLVKMARDVEFTFLNGGYQKSTGGDVANKTRGMFALCAEAGGISIDAQAQALSKELFNQLMRDMADKGAYFNNMVLFCGAYQKQVLSELFAGQLPGSRNVGGVNITEIETDFCKMGIVWDRFVPADRLLIADLAHVAPVFQPVPGKGVLFEEQLAKTGATEKSQLYAQIGLAHGPAFLHGALTNLKMGG